MKPIEKEYTIIENLSKKAMGIVNEKSCPGCAMSMIKGFPIKLKNDTYLIVDVVEINPATISVYVNKI